MSFTPGARAYGKVDDYFSGAVNRMGWQVETGATILATWGSKESNLADALKAPALVLNVYAPPDAPPDDYSQYMFDVIWGSNAAELIEFGVHLSPKLKEDLVGDTKAFVLIVNQMDTLTADRFAGASNWSFIDVANKLDPAAYNCKGVVRLRKQKVGYGIETYLRGHVNWWEVTELMAPELRERLSPRARTIPFRNPFEGMLCGFPIPPIPFPRCNVQGVMLLRKCSIWGESPLTPRTPRTPHTPLTPLPSPPRPPHRRSTGSDVLPMANHVLPLTPRSGATHRLSIRW